MPDPSKVIVTLDDGSRVVVTLGDESAPPAAPVSAPSSKGFVVNALGSLGDLGTGTVNFVKRAASQSPVDTLTDMVGGAAHRVKEYADDLHPVEAASQGVGGSANAATLSALGLSPIAVGTPGHATSTLSNLLPVGLAYRDPVGVGADALLLKGGASSAVRGGAAARDAILGRGSLEPAIASAVEDLRGNPTPTLRTSLPPHDPTAHTPEGAVYSGRMRSWSPERPTNPADAMGRLGGSRSSLEDILQDAMRASMEPDKPRMTTLPPEPTTAGAGREPMAGTGKRGKAMAATSSGRPSTPQISNAPAPMEPVASHPVSYPDRGITTRSHDTDAVFTGSSADAIGAAGDNLPQRIEDALAQNDHSSVLRFRAILEALPESQFQKYSTLYSRLDDAIIRRQKGLPPATPAETAAIERERPVDTPASLDDLRRLHGAKVAAGDERFQDFAREFGLPVNAETVRGLTGGGPSRTPLHLEAGRGVQNVRTTERLLPDSRSGASIEGLDESYRRRIADEKGSIPPDLMTSLPAILESLMAGYLAKSMGLPGAGKALSYAGRAVPPTLAAAEAATLSSHGR